MTASTTPPPIEHYENFPVASWLCPPALRAPIAAIYHFARTADDLADEGTFDAPTRLRDLAAYRAELLACAAGSPARGGRWPRVFEPLSAQIARHALPLAPLQDLLSAFEQDVRHSAAGAAYADIDALLRYCQRSAAPVGRLLLHLYGVAEPAALAHSDAICSALQLINFWQDLSVDIPRGRYYLPLAECARHSLPTATPDALWRAQADPTRLAALVAALAGDARARMHAGQSLARRLPGRAGWELRAVVQGGLRTLDKIEALGARVLHQRPALSRADWPRIAWRALCM